MEMLVRTRAGAVAMIAFLHYDVSNIPTEPLSLSLQRQVDDSNP